MISNGLTTLAADFGKSCLSLVSSIPFPQLALLPMASAQPSDSSAVVHKEKEEEPQDLVVEVPLFPSQHDVDVFSFTSIKPSSKELSPSSPSQVISFHYPPLFTTILTSLQEIDWSSPEFDKTSLVSMRDSWNRTIFLAAVEEGRGGAVRVLLTHDIAVYSLDSQGNNGLALAALNGYADLVPLLSNYLSINSLNTQGLAPIHQAIRQGHSQVVQALVRNGASLTIGWKSPEGPILSPVALAVMSGDIATLEVLIKEDDQGGIDLTQPIIDIGTLAHLAILSDQTPMLEYLLEKQYVFTQGLLEHVDFLGRTPLHLASYRSNLPAIRVLVRQGADIERADKENERKPIHFAALGKQPEAIRLLDWLDAQLQSTDKEGRTPEVLLKSQLGQLKNEELSLANQCLALLDKLPRIAKKYKAQPPDFSRHPPINLIFQGGGLKQIAYAGAIRKMEELNALSEVKRVAGTSAGTITTVLLSVGYTSSELTNFFSHDFVDLTEEKLLKTFEEGVSKAMLEHLKAVLKEYWRGWKTMFSPVKTAKELYKGLFSIPGLTGLCQGEALRKWVDELIQQATKTKEHPEGMTHCTFGELHDLVLKHPGKYRDPYIFSIRLSKLDPSDIVRFSYEDPKWKSLIISDAVRASVSIPMIFKPHTLHLKDPEGTRYPIEGYGAFVDGGLIRNFPLDAFDDNRYQQNKRDWGGATNRRTLGLSLRVISEITPEQIDKIESTKGLLQAVVSTYFHAEEILAYKESYNQDRAILISAGKDIGFMRPDVENTRQQALLESGEEAILLFFQNSLGKDLKPIIDPARAEDIRLFSPHPDFVGRKEYLDLLEKALIVNPKEWDIRLPVKVRLLWGLGGMGKSELAIKFANSHLNTFSIVWTIHHENEASTDQSYRELAERLKIFIRDKPSTQQVQRKVHAYLENNPFEKPWLLLLDNVENQIKQHDLPQRGGVVLITARHSFVRTSVEERIKVEGLSKMEAVTLLSRITGEKESKEMYQLAEDLGNFPLALNQAAHYIKDTPASSIAKYQRVYSLAKDPLRGPASEDDRYRYTLKTVWNITFEKLEKESPDTIYWLKACAHLAPAEIPLNWLETWAGGVAESEGILRTLQQYALMKHDKAEDSLFLHKLLQIVIRVQASKNEVVKIQESLLRRGLPPGRRSAAPHSARRRPGASWRRCATAAGAPCP
ncbi:MAG: patatin-like phospholipase family protein, partial [Chlamydiales bacterium]|nr:patatin-like phospholipase family protein [Chlamydiales bacterium]